MEPKVEMTEVELFIAAHRVASVLFEYVDRHFVAGSKCPSILDCRRQEANPFYHQTASGLFLEISYGVPCSLWTPWGEWSFGGDASGLFEEVVERLRERLGLKLHRPQRNCDEGTIGPIYAVTRVDDKELPPATEMDCGKYRSYEECKRAWRRHTEQTERPRRLVRLGR